MSRLHAVLLAALVVVGGGCQTRPDDAGAGAAGASSIDCSTTVDAEHPDVVDVELEPVGDRRYEVSATLCSAYDSPERYADAWRVRTPDGEVLGVRELLHDHAAEQPFTRSLGSAITVPEGVDMVVVEGRDLDNGWGGGTFEADLPTP